MSEPTPRMRTLVGLVLALTISRGTAHAYPPRYYDCGNAFVKIQTDHGTAPSGRRVFPTTWTIQENWEKEDRQNLRPITSLNFKCKTTGEEGEDKCWLNGKFCRKMSDEEGQKEFSDEN
jgi:hypothetical protein